MRERNPASNTYAQALFEAAASAGNADDLTEELQSLRDDVFSDASVHTFLMTPKITPAEKKKALEQALEGKVSGLVMNFLKVLIDRKRQVLFAEIVDAFRELCDKASGRTYVTITAASALEESSKNRIVESIGKKLSTEVVAEERVDETLLGGLTIQIGDTVVDGSVRARLAELRDVVKSRRIGKELIQ